MKIGRKIWRRSGIGAMTNSQRNSQLQSKRRTIKMLILVVIVFSICWLPLNLYNLYLDFDLTSIYSKEIFILCHWIGVSSGCYNPFIYFWLNKQYNARAKSILKMCFKCCRVKKGSSSSNCSSSNENRSNSTRAKYSIALKENLPRSACENLLTWQSVPPITEVTVWNDGDFPRWCKGFCGSTWTELSPHYHFDAFPPKKVIFTLFVKLKKNVCNYFAYFV